MKRWLVAGLLMLGAPAALAADFPTKPIRLIVPFLAGGSGDVTARIIFQKVSQDLGQPVIVDNRPGAGGNLGMDLAAKAPPDGYTISVCSTPMAINATLYKNVPFDTLAAFEPVTRTVEEPNILVVNPEVPVSTVAELIALAKAKPGELSFASSGNGTVTHLSGELFRAMAKIDILHIPYRGVPPALTDTMGGRTTMFFSGQGAASGYIKTGKLKALASTGPSPSKLFPNLPTVGATIPGYEANVWLGIVAPAGTPKEIVRKLNHAIQAAMESDEVRGKLEAQGYQVAGTTPEAFAALIRDEVGKWGAVVKATGAKVD